MFADRVALAHVRHAIDWIDDALLLLLAARLRLARHAGRCTRRAGLPLRDPAREARVRARARAESLAIRIGLPEATARRAIAFAIDGACRTQGFVPDLDQGGAPGPGPMIAPAMHAPPSADARSSLLRLLPPPTRCAPVRKRCSGVCWNRRWRADWPHRWVPVRSSSCRGGSLASRCPILA